MSNKKKSTKEKTLTDIASEMIIQGPEGPYSVADIVSGRLSCVTRRDVFAYIYATYHLDNVCEPYFVVENAKYNPFSDDFTDEIPIRLSEEEAKLADLSFADFLNRCEYLMDNEIARGIGACVSTDPNGGHRYSVKYKPLWYGENEIDASVHGCSKEKNDEIYDKLFEECSKKLAELKYI